jgi:hypothetical protein
VEGLLRRRSGLSRLLSGRVFVWLRWGPLRGWIDVGQRGIALWQPRGAGAALLAVSLTGPRSDGKSLPIERSLEWELKRFVTVDIHLPDNLDWDITEVLGL